MYEQAARVDLTNHAANDEIRLDIADMYKEKAEKFQREGTAGPEQIESLYCEAIKRYITALNAAPTNHTVRIRAHMQLSECYREIGDSRNSGKAKRHAIREAFMASPAYTGCIPGVQEVTEAEAQRLFAKGRAIRVPAPVVIEPDDVIQEPEVNE